MVVEEAKRLAEAIDALLEVLDNVEKEGTIRGDEYDASVSAVNLALRSFRLALQAAA